MATAATLYNTLPTLEDAEKRFVEREKLFAAVGQLLAEYGNVFGLCLVHAHCILTDDEIMLARGNVSQPEKATSLVEYYPERWLCSGEAYEFTTRPTTPPPAALLAAFNQLTSHIGVLGLYHIDNEDKGRMVEHTDGRKNILTPLSEASAQLANHTETAWNLGKGDPVTMSCMIVCDSRITRGSAAHKGTRSHYPI
ncbi:hypothetical protein I7I50_04757 [Histoplasma capsulatum G186AR]|uniref:Uncharacterized protein n=1 Tax=Ajellomyces capsulatus TaxID=5037 RepID=A0A8H8CY72_AJECA|nr:hypothetical protein I7I52_05666 [Histoplasma capsulatum]QSS75578.1 hypothetical protein I7I50_04757 [Histoplasma capsulatum G186AR]